MDDKELLEYKQKLKGLSLKELNDILTHIHPAKVPEKYRAVQEEILLRPGGVLQQTAEPVVAQPEAAAVQAAYASGASPKPRAQEQKAQAAPRAATSKLDALLTAASMLFIALALYLLLIPFVPLPGSHAVREMLSGLPPHF